VTGPETGGRLLLAATPLGQPADASARLVEALASADVIAAEDTRRVRTLAQSLGVRPGGRIVSFFDQNETWLQHVLEQGALPRAGGRQVL